jgi:hypothetical protein
VATGITFGIELEGLVPPYEEYAAMVSAHFNTSEWQTLAAEERAQAVAYWRLSRLIELHQGDAVAIHAQRANANAG